MEIFANSFTVITRSMSCNKSFLKILALYNSLNYDLLYFFEARTFCRIVAWDAFWMKLGKSWNNIQTLFQLLLTNPEHSTFVFCSLDLKLWSSNCITIKIISSWWIARQLLFSNSNSPCLAECPSEIFLWSISSQLTVGRNIAAYLANTKTAHDDVIKWKHSPCYWPFVRGIHRSPVNYPHKGQWRGALIFFFNLRLNKQLNKQSWG